MKNCSFYIEYSYIHLVARRRHIARHIMWFLQVVHFLHLAILHFRPEMLVLVGDHRTLSELQHVHHSLNVTLPSVVLSISSESQINSLQRRSYHQHCCATPNQLTVIFFNINNHLIWLRTLLKPTIENSNPMVLVSGRQTELERIHIANVMYSFNMVTIEIDHLHPIRVFAWRKLVRPTPTAQMSRFEGPDAIFRSDDSNALVFRRQMRRFASSATATTTTARMLTQIMAPYTFLLMGGGDNNGGGQPETLFVTSSALTLFQVIGAKLNVAVQILSGRDCAACFVGMPSAVVAPHRGRDRQLFDYNQHTSDNPAM